MSKEKELLELFDDAINKYPFLLFELGYTRVTDWMVHIWNKAGGVEVKILTTQAIEREDACEEAIIELKKFLGVE